MSEPCFFLEKMPAEMRNEIYKLTFESNSSDIYLPSASPPNKALLLACHQVYNEAKGVYKKAYQDYWKDGKFWMGRGKRQVGQFPNNTSLLSQVPAKAIDIEHITQLSIKINIDTRIITVELIDKRGMWKVANVLHPRTKQATEEYRIVRRYVNGVGFAGIPSAGIPNPGVRGTSIKWELDGDVWETLIYTTREVCIAKVHNAPAMSVVDHLRFILNSKFE